MLTDYGKLVRKHRIDRGMTLREMAGALEISPAFLSATETGRKSVPRELVDRIVKCLDLDIADRAELVKAIEKSKTEFKVRLGGQASGKDREVAAMFARQFPEMSDADKEAIRKILEGRRE